MGIYIGFVEIKGYEPTIFFNFKPIAEVKGNDVLILTTSDREELEKAKSEIEVLRGRLKKISLLKLRNDSTTERMVGRPRIKHVKYNLAVDLDTDLALKVLRTASDENWTRLVNYIIRDWLYDHHPECYDRIKSTDGDQN
jgi:hypothetical protein